MEVVVFEQNGSGQQKIDGIRRYGRNVDIVQIIDIVEELPEFLDNPEEFIPLDFSGDLVLDFLVHQDLSDYLVHLCVEKQIPIISSGKKNQEAITPFTCCGLGFHKQLGPYGQQFGLPEYKVTLDGDRIVALQVVRGAPCGATWEVITRVAGSEIDEALTLLPREVQYLCVANPGRFDPISGKSPVHHAGHVHRTALQKAIDAAKNRGE